MLRAGARQPGPRLRHADRSAARATRGRRVPATSPEAAGRAAVDRTEPVAEGFYRRPRLEPAQRRPRRHPRRPLAVMNDDRLPDPRPARRDRRTSAGRSPRCCGTCPTSTRILAGAFELSHLPNRAELRLKNDRQGDRLHAVAGPRRRAAALIGATLFFKDLTRVEQLEERERLRDRLAALGEMAAASPTRSRTRSPASR